MLKSVTTEMRYWWWKSVSRSELSGSLVGSHQRKPPSAWLR